MDEQDDERLLSSLRKSLGSKHENKTKVLVDMYTSPDVNKQLVGHFINSGTDQNYRPLPSSHPVPRSIVQRPHSPPVRGVINRTLPVNQLNYRNPIDVMTAVNSTMLTNITPKSLGSKVENKRIDMLLKDLEAVRGENIKLEERLIDVNKQLDVAKVTLQSRDLELDASSASQRMALVEEIYTAQQIRDKAMLQRLELANRERDMAIAKLKETEVHSDGYVSGNEDDGNTDINLLLKAISSQNASPLKINTQGEKMIIALKNQHAKQKREYEDTIKELTKTKDDAVHKMEICELKSLADSVEFNKISQHYNKESFDNLKNQLDALKADLVTSLDQRKDLESEISKLRLYYNLHNSLSQEDSLRSEFNKKISKLEKEIKTRDVEIQTLRKQKTKLQVEFKRYSENLAKNEQTKCKLEDMVENYKSKAERSERTITVLRRKVNALSMKTR